MFVEANAENPGLKKITWPTSKKAQLAEILSEDYMSSEESDVEGKFLVKKGLPGRVENSRKEGSSWINFIMNNTASAQGSAL